MIWRGDLLMGGVSDAIGAPMRCNSWGASVRTYSVAIAIPRHSSFYRRGILVCLVPSILCIHICTSTHNFGGRGPCNETRRRSEIQALCYVGRGRLQSILTALTLRCLPLLTIRQTPQMVPTVSVYCPVRCHGPSYLSSSAASANM